MVIGVVSERNQCHLGRVISYILASEFQLGPAQGLIGVNWKVCVPVGSGSVGSPAVPGIP